MGRSIDTNIHLASPTPFSMRDEATFTDRNSSHWTSRNLRYSRVNFVSAGKLGPDFDIQKSTTRSRDERPTPESSSTVDACRSFARDNLALANVPVESATGTDVWKAFVRNKIAVSDAAVESTTGADARNTFAWDKLARLTTFSHTGPVLSNGPTLCPSDVVSEMDTNADVDPHDDDRASKTLSRSKGIATGPPFHHGVDPPPRHEHEFVQPTGDAASSGMKDDTPETSCPFFVDTAGETPSVAIPAYHHPIRTPSPTPSISSSADEIVFRGRCNMTRAFVDPVPSNSREPELPSTEVDRPIQEAATNIPSSDHPTSSESAAVNHPEASPDRERSPANSESRKGQASMSGDGKALVGCNHSGVSGTTAISKQIVHSWADHGEDWVHRSKPGHGWTRPRGVARPKAAWEHLLTEEDHDEVYAEFVQTTDERIALEHANLPQPDQATAPVTAVQISSCSQASSGGLALLSPNISISSANNPQASGLGGSVADEVDNADFELVSSEDSEEEDSNEERDDGPVTKDPTYDDENLARLLQKQESLGLGFNQLALCDGAVEDNLMDRDHGYSDGDKREGDVSDDAAVRYLRNSPKKTKRSRNVQAFPSASALADAVEEDPYNGFDVMDFDRPSLRRKAKSKAPQIDLSNEELEAQLQSTWQKDREKKKKRKQDREELRTLGMLGSKSKSKLAKDKLFEGMSLAQVREELRKFLGSTNDM
jgi:hypothetical protein